MTKNESSLVFATQSLTGLEVGEEYTVWLQVTGGTPSYSFAVGDGTVPPGIEITPIGTVDASHLRPARSRFQSKPATTPAMLANKASM